MKKLIQTLPLAFVLAALAFSCKSQAASSDVVSSNTVCPISGHPVDGTSYYEYDGKKIYTCCDKCLAKVQADPEAAEAKAYPAK